MKVNIRKNFSNRYYFRLKTLSIFILIILLIFQEVDLSLMRSKLNFRMQKFDKNLLQKSTNIKGKSYSHYKKNSHESNKLKNRINKNKHNHNKHKNSKNENTNDKKNDNSNFANDFLKKFSFKSGKSGKSVFTTDLNAKKAEEINKNNELVSMKIVSSTKDELAETKDGKLKKDVEE